MPPFIKLYLNDELVGTAKAESKTAGEYSYQLYTSGTGDFVEKSGHESLYATFMVPYKEGTLRAEAWTAENGEQISNTQGRAQVETVGNAVSLNATADRTSIAADGRDLSYITIDVEDAQGRFVNGAEPQINVSITGSGKIVAVDNARHDDHTPFTSTSRQAMKGKLLVIVQSTEEAGNFTVTANAEGLNPASVTVTTTPVEQESQPDRIVSYEMSRNFYVLKGNPVTLPQEVTLTYADGKTAAKAVEWEEIDPSRFEGKRNLLGKWNHSGHRAYHTGKCNSYGRGCRPDELFHCYFGGQFSLLAFHPSSSTGRRNYSQCRVPSRMDYCRWKALAGSNI